MMNKNGNEFTLLKEDKRNAQFDYFGPLPG